MFVFDEFTAEQHYVQLVLPERTQAPAIFEVLQRNQTEFAKWLPWVLETKSAEDEAKFLMEARVRFAKYEALTLIILVDDQPVGSVDLHNIDTDFHTAEVGYWLDAHYQGQGIMTRAVQHLTEAAFVDLNLHKLSIQADAKNLNSIAVAERAGYTYEATLKEQIINQGEYRDEVIYSKINEV
ncbi:ribosomal-protein-serine acetyltransferase [Weissella uvarum]|uniref:GNAT family N-acetyltransferase n=1 Tax=Weissella uvarum TaxID=1479233 RepID=UPI0019614E47|nr:GNAT family protein [Weissella uvarum]MBM7617408.1 ribosomal-protein-serine acetyltransferase [Weissella uvarum]MCM0595707.1 GNAT family N-acetyltransferase [Weissella uvarum]